MNYRLSEIRRSLDLREKRFRAAFLWGPRKTGKTTLLHQQFPKAKFYDLLKTDLRTELLLHPEKLRQEILAGKNPLVVIDEIQKVPSLLDEVHWCLENTQTRFILCGSSARKLRHGAANLLGGRAERFELFPLTTDEITLGKIDLIRLLNHGLLPEHYLTGRPDRLLKGYVLDYLNEEIRAEALTRNVPAFGRFLESLATSHGFLLNYANFARDCGVSPKTVREYFQILEDTLIGHTLPPWRHSRSRRLIETAKFYLFDVGIVRALKGLQIIQSGTEEFGWAFEHFLIEEVRAYLSYSEKDLPLSFWKTSTGLEVDLIIGDLDLAVEFKSTPKIRAQDLKALQALREDQRVRQCLIVSTIPRALQLTPEILAIPWQQFCENLWGGKLI